MLRVKHMPGLITIENAVITILGATGQVE